MINRTRTQFRFNAGFTLIELIIVIGVMAVLTLGLLIAVDPVENLARGRDTNRRRAAIEYLGALQRYLSARTTYPWGNGATAFAIGDADTLNTLISSGDLSYKFSSQISIPSFNGITITAQSVDQGAKVWVCFDPESKGISRDLNSKYSTPGSGACSPQSSDFCFFCAE